MKRIQSATIGCVGALALFAMLGFSYRLGRHSVVETDELVVLGSPTNVRWSSVAPLPGGLSFVSNPPMIGTAQVDKGDVPTLTAKHSAMHSNGAQVSYVTMKSHDDVTVDVDLVSRDIVNCFGTKLLSWKCRAYGAVARDGGEYYLFIQPTGGGDAGYTVSFNTVKTGRSAFRMTISERLWGKSTRQCELGFRVNNDGTIQTVDAL